MKVESAIFVKSAMRPEDYPRDRKPEVAFVGRSNVGKSSLLNRLLGQKGLAKTSGTPGKTRTINFFRINDRFYCVDLPGYGFAKAPKQMKEEWNRVMAAYLRERDTLGMVIALIDSRHEPMPHDVMMIEMLQEAEVPTLVVATKVDKLRPSQRARHLKRLSESLGLPNDAPALSCSAVSGEGMRELLGIIEEQLKL